MCDYGDYEEISTKTVCIRRPRSCDSCQTIMPRGTMMLRLVGKTEGDFGVCYGCPTCLFCMRQDDHTEMHLCWNWSYDDYETQVDGHEVPGQWVYDYVRYCLENGETPTAEGCRTACEQRHQVELLEV